jgi:hypothetical protein
VWMSFASPIAKHDGSVPIAGKMWGVYLACCLTFSRSES